MNLARIVILSCLALGAAQASANDLLPVEAFASKPVVSNVRLSPDGRIVAFLVKVDTPTIQGTAVRVLNFDTGDYGPGTDVSGEYGFGNNDGTGGLQNFFTSNQAQSMPFGGANLDGPVNIDGPQGGLVADPLLIPLGGLGAIQDQVIATLNLTKPINNLDFLENGVRVEFGSDAAFIDGEFSMPAPGALAVLALAGLAVGRRRR